ncbi:hypothetical protein [Candidatus Odyssella acanthamoebae]|nr:hypothetical protein [Candidatus Paracaedibacter acanthamoebae]
MKIRSLMCLALLSTVSHTAEPFNEVPFDFDSLRGKGAVAQQQTLDKFVRKYNPSLPTYMTVRNLTIETYKINTSIKERQQQSLLQPRVDPRVQVLTEKLGRKTEKLTTVRLQLATQQAEFSQLQNQVRGLENQVATLTTSQRRDQLNISTLQQQLGAANNNFNAKQLELTQVHNTHARQAQELQQQITALLEEKEGSQGTLARVTHQLKTARSEINAKQERLERAQSDYYQEAEELQQQITTLIKQKKSDQQALDELQQKLETAIRENNAKQEELEQVQREYGQQITLLIQNLNDLTTSKQLDQQALNAIQDQLDIANNLLKRKEDEVAHTKDKHAEKIKKLHDQIADLIESGQQKQQILADTQQELNSATNEILNKQRQFEAIQQLYRGQVDSFEEQLRELRISNATQQQTLEEYQIQLEHAENKILETKHQLAEVQEARKIQVHNLEEEITKLMESNDVKQQTLEERQLQLEEAKNELQQKELQFAAARNGHENEIYSLEEKIKNLIKLTETQQQTSDTQQIQLKQAENKIQQTEHQLAEAQEAYKLQVHNLEEEITKLTASSEVQQQTLEERQMQLEEAKNELQQKELQFAATRNEHKNEICSLAEKIKNLTELTETQQQTSDTQQHQLEQAENKIQHTEHQLSEVQEAHKLQVHKLEEEITKLTASSDVKQEMLEERQMQLEEAKNELQQKELQFAAARNGHENEIYSLEEKLKI